MVIPARVGEREHGEAAREDAMPVPGNGDVRLADEMKLTHIKKKKKKVHLSKVYKVNQKYK